MISETPLLRSFAIQMRVIGALLMREVLTRYGRHNIGFMWIFLEPMLFTVGVLMLWLILGTHKTNLPIIPFTITGYASVLMWRNTINRCGNAVEPNRALMHHRNVRVIDLFTARLVLEAAGASMSFLFLSLAFILTELMPTPDDILKMIFAWLLLTWFSISMALIIGSLSALSDIVDRVWHVASYLFLPLSGAFFMVDWLPKYAQGLALMIPTVNCNELLREGYFGNQINSHYSVLYVVIVNTVLMLPGLSLVKFVSLRVEGE